MKCSECKWWQKSKWAGNHCKFQDDEDSKPCNIEYRKKAHKAKKKKKMERYDKSMRKVRYDNN